MNQIKNFWVEHNLFLDAIKYYIQDEFDIENQKTLDTINAEIKRFVSSLKSEIKFIVETPYIDKVYRDSYYHYYASKLDTYPRNCIKVALFDVGINEHDFNSKEGVEKLQKHFGGFFVIQPTPPKVIGRNAISPKMLKENKFECCLTEIGVTVNGAKFKVKAFPASGQTVETTSCADICVWETLEYYANRYIEYTPIVPSTIRKILKNTFSERQLPVAGLRVSDISTIFKKMGFGSKIYAKPSTLNGQKNTNNGRASIALDKGFYQMLGVYIESNLPVVLALEGTRNKVEYKHAVLAIGRDKWDDSEFIEGVCIANENDESIFQINWHDHSTRKLVILDDNHTPYQLIDYKGEIPFYGTGNTDDSVEITHFIVPLDKRVHLDAGLASEFITRLLKEPDNRFGIRGEDTEIVTKLYLCSSRSYKNWAILNDSLDDIEIWGDEINKERGTLKHQIIATPLPKFVWVCELASTQEEMEKGNANGLILLDATQPTLDDFAPLIFAFFKNKFLTFATPHGKKVLNKDSLKQNTRTFSVFNQFNNI